MTDKTSKIAEAIRKKYKNEADCARTLGWNRQKLNRILNKTRNVTFDDLPKLAKALGMSSDNLIKCLRKE